MLYTVYLIDIYQMEVFPSKCAWKRIIYEKTSQRSNPKLFMNVSRATPLALH